MKHFFWKALVLLLVLPASVSAAELPLWEFGLRGGMDAEGAGATNLKKDYAAGEAYLLRALPWRTDLAGGTLMARLDLGVGYLEADGDNGNWLAAGADLVWLPGDGTIEIEAGFRPVLLADHRYGPDDFGGTVQFSSHAGMTLNLSGLILDYRYQHLSNANLYKENPGINLHLFGAGVRF